MVACLVCVAGSSTDKAKTSFCTHFTSDLFSREQSLILNQISTRLPVKRVGENENA